MTPDTNGLILPGVSETYLNAKQAAAVLGCHEDTVKKYAAEGTIPATRTIGRHWRFRREDLEPFIGLVGRPAS